MIPLNLNSNIEHLIRTGFVEWFDIGGVAGYVQGVKGCMNRFSILKTLKSVQVHIYGYSDNWHEITVTPLIQPLNSYTIELEYPLPIDIKIHDDRDKIIGTKYISSISEKVSDELKLIIEEVFAEHGKRVEVIIDNNKL